MHLSDNLCVWVVAGGMALSAAGTTAAQDRPKNLILAEIMSATVAPNGLAFASLSGTDKSPANRTDGSLALGFGLGDQNRTLGVQVTAQITSLTKDSTGPGFGDSGYISLKFGRRLGSEPLYLGLQVDHLANWGSARKIDASAKVALSYFSNLSAGGENYPVLFTLGVGKVRDTRQDVGLFGGVGIGLTQYFGASLAYSGDYFDIGLGFRPTDNLSVVAALDDPFDQKDRRRVTVSVTYIWRNLWGS